MSKRRIDATLEEDSSDSKLRDVGLNILDENFIPQDMARINGEMAKDEMIVEASSSIPGWSAILARTILRELQYLCKDIDQSMNMDRAYTVHNSLDSILREAWEKGDYSLVTRIEKFRAAKPISGDLPIPEGLRVAKDAWMMPFVGKTDNVLWQNVQNMDDARRREAGGNVRYYMNHVSIVQSSGTGKSRLVDEVAKRTFTIPFNLRKECGTQGGGGWPPPDRDIGQLMTNFNKSLELSVYRRYLCLFETIFQCVESEVELLSELASQYRDRQSLASAWRSHLERDKRQARVSLYAKICEQAEKKEVEVTNKEQAIKQSHQGTEEKERKQEALTSEISDNAQTALRSLIACVEKLAPSEDEIAVLIYFDEAHALASEDIRFPNLNNDDVPSKYLLDILTKSLNAFQDLSFFTIFLSTQSKLEYVAPSSHYARSARYKKHIKDVHAPITETPFDCFGDRPLVPAQLLADDLHDVVFMGLFGRPLWRSMLHEFTEEVTNRVTEPSMSSDDQMNVGLVPSKSMQSVRCSDVLSYARSKLLHQENPSKIRTKHPLTAQSAVLDVRIMLSYEANREQAEKHVTELISSHMRTVFSIPQGQEFVRSGYPSEPILAEAAARQLNIWRSEEKGKIEPALQIISEHLDHDLLSRGEVGEAVGRMLLMLARDRASVEENGSKNPEFSKAVSLTRFIEELFPKKHAEKILNCRPDNQISTKRRPTPTLREVFKDAVINFTHFAKWGDDTATTQDAALVSFIRHMAPICRNGAQAVDVAIPVLLRPASPLSPEVMTMVLVQFKLQAKAGSRVAYSISQETVSLFPAEPNMVAGGLEPRPYISLIMELGVQPTLPLLAQTPTNPNSKTAKRLRKSLQTNIGQNTSRRTTEKVSSLERLFIPQPPTQIEEKHQHDKYPRYNIFAYGCSPEIYEVIKEVDRESYKTVLQRSHLLADHPRLDPDSLEAVRSQKPFFSTGPPSFGWVKNEILNKG